MSRGTSPRTSPGGPAAPGTGGGCPRQDPAVRYASPRPGDEPLVGLSSSRCPVWPCRCLKSPFLSDDQVFRWFSCAHEHSMRFPPVVDDPNKRETPQPRIYTHVDACLYMCVSTYTRVPACRPAEPSALAPPTSQFGPNPPNVGGGRPARRPLLSLLSPTQPVSFPALSLLSVSLPPNAPRRPVGSPRRITSPFCCRF